DAGDLGVGVVPAAGEVEAAVAEVGAVAGHQVDAAGAGIDRIGEVAAAVDPEDAARFQQVPHRVAGEVGRERDAFVDLDVVRVEGDVERVHRLQHQAQAVGQRFLRLQRLGAEGLRHRAGGGEGADLE